MSQNDDSAQKAENQEMNARTESTSVDASVQNAEQATSTSFGADLDEFKELDELRQKMEQEGQQTQTESVKDEEKKSEPEPTAEKAAEADGKDESKPAEPATDLQAEIERLKREIRSRDGKYGGELAKIRKEKEELEARLQAEDEAKKAKELEAVDPNADPTDDDLKAAFGDDFEDQIGREFAIRQLKATRREQARMLGTVDKLIQRKLAGIQEKMSVERLMSELESAVPGANALNAEADVNGFAGYLDGEFSGTGFTRREVAERSIGAIRAGADGKTFEREKARLVSIFKGFSSTGDEASSAPPTNQTKAPAAKPSSKPDKSLYMSPATSAADSVPKGAKMTLKQVEDALDKAASGGDFDKAMRLVLEKAARGEVA